MSLDSQSPAAPYSTAISDSRQFVCRYAPSNCVRCCDSSSLATASGPPSPLKREAADEYHFGRITIQMHAFGNAPPQSPSAPAPPKGEPRNLLPPPGEVPRSGQGGVLGGGATCSAFTAKLKCIEKHNYSMLSYSSAALKEGSLGGF